jgi:hypothetical protein
MVEDEDDSSAGIKCGAGDRSCDDDRTLLVGCVEERAVGVEEELAFEHCVLFAGGVCDIDDSNRLGVSA